MCGGGFFDSVANIATGGVYGAVTGEWGDTKDIMPFVNPGVVSARGVYDGIKEGDWASAIQYAVDPVTEPGVDWLARRSGEKIEQAAPGLLNTVSPVVEGAATIYAPWAGLAAYQLMNKMKGGTANQALMGGAIRGATYGASSAVGQYLSGLDKFGESMAGASGAETTGYLSRQAAAQAAAQAANGGRYAVPYSQWTGQGGEAAVNAMGKGLVYDSPAYLQAAAELGVDPAIGLADYFAAMPQWAKQGVDTAGNQLKKIAGKNILNLAMNGMMGSPQQYMPSGEKGFNALNYATTGNNWTSPELAQAQQQMAQAQQSPGTVGAFSEQDPNDGRFKYLRDYINDITGKPDYLKGYSDYIA